MNINQRGFSTLLVIVVLLVVVVIGYFAFVQKPAEQTSPLLVGDNAIYVSDIKPATMVNVGFAILSGGGYVVIHEDSEGKPGAIVGNSILLPQGENRDFEVTLSQESVDGEVLYAMLHSDNGDGVFNPAEDSPIQDNQGNIILMRFQVSSNATEPEVISL